MPEAHAAYEAAQARIPRTIFHHAHDTGLAGFPPLTTSDPIIYLLLPDNWNGTDKLVVWFLVDLQLVNAPFTFTLDAGTCAEAPNIHTQTAANVLISGAANTYLCVDLTTELAVVIALLNSRDMLRMTVDDVDEMSGWVVGMEIQET